MSKKKKVPPYKPGAPDSDPLNEGQEPKPVEEDNIGGPEPVEDTWTDEDEAKWEKHGGPAPNTSDGGKVEANGEPGDLSSLENPPALVTLKPALVGEIVEEEFVPMDTGPDAAGPDAVKEVSETVKPFVFTTVEEAGPQIDECYNKSKERTGRALVECGLAVAYLREAGVGLVAVRTKLGKGKFKAWYESRNYSPASVYRAMNYALYVPAGKLLTHEKAQELVRVERQKDIEARQKPVPVASQGSDEASEANPADGTPKPSEATAKPALTASGGYKTGKPGKPPKPVGGKPGLRAFNPDGSPPEKSERSPRSLPSNPISKIEEKRGVKYTGKELLAIANEAYRTAVNGMGDRGKITDRALFMLAGGVASAAFAAHHSDEAERPKHVEIAPDEDFRQGDQSMFRHYLEDFLSVVRLYAKHLPPVWTVEAAASLCSVASNMMKEADEATWEDAHLAIEDIRTYAKRFDTNRPKE